MPRLERLHLFSCTRDRHHPPAQFPTSSLHVIITDDATRESSILHHASSDATSRSKHTLAQYPTSRSIICELSVVPNIT
eukprot:1535914-Rhodomonas_salina.4